MVVKYTQHKTSHLKHFFKCTAQWQEGQRHSSEAIVTPPISGICLSSQTEADTH